jgi:NADH-quinone oxidoreductase subunit H
MSSLNVIFFLGGWLPLFNFFYISPFIWFAIKIILMVFLFILIRAMLPRYRYDQLMYLGWKVFLPLSLGFLIFYSGILIGFNWLP